MTMLDSIQAARRGDPVMAPDGCSAALDYCFAASQPVFVGHFPGRPILPGVFLIEMARVTAEAALRRALIVREIVKAKFLVSIGPGETVRVELKWTEIDRTIEARAGFSVFGRRVGEVTMVLGRNE